MGIKKKIWDKLSLFADGMIAHLKNSKWFSSYQKSDRIQ
jgi:hypothetical protein